MRLVAAWELTDVLVPQREFRRVDVVTHWQIKRMALIDDAFSERAHWGWLCWDHCRHELRQRRCETVFRNLGLQILLVPSYNDGLHHVNHLQQAS